MNNSHPLHCSIHTRLRFYHLNSLLPDSWEKLLDVGCGAGYFLKRWQTNDKKTFGVDSDNESIEYAKKLGIKNVLAHSAENLPYPNSEFDVAVCSEVLEHLPQKELPEFLNEISRVIKVNGSLIITVPCLAGFRSLSKLRNLGHEEPGTAEYHVVKGYEEEELRVVIDSCPQLKVVTTKHSMFFLSELFMDFMKYVFYKKNKMKGQGDLQDITQKPIFKIYSFFFPLLYGLFILEDIIFLKLLRRGHILILKCERIE